MDEYFFVLTAINIFVLAFMGILVSISETLNIKQRRSFITAYMLIALISVIELATVVLEELPGQYRILNIIANFLGFGLTPAVPLCLVNVLTKKVDAKLHLGRAALCELIYLVFLAASIPFGLVFSVDADNVYSRGAYFMVYVITYYASILYLMLATLYTAGYFQNRSKTLIVPITAFLIGGTTLQIVFPYIHVTWLCVTLISVMYFIYCNEMWTQLDGLTGLLNQNSYLNRTAEKHADDRLMIVFDVDSFKQVNDTYGHLIGDKCLMVVADCIKKAYSKYGFCYRIGGDEFCVLMKNASAADKCTDKFIRLLEKRRAEQSFIPHVSYGFSELSVNENILTAKERADQNMYIFKKEHKRRLSIEAALSEARAAKSSAEAEDGKAADDVPATIA